MLQLHEPSQLLLAQKLQASFRTIQQEVPPSDAHTTVAFLWHVIMPPRCGACCARLGRHCSPPWERTQVQVNCDAETWHCVTAAEYDTAVPTGCVSVVRAGPRDRQLVQWGGWSDLSLFRHGLRNERACGQLPRTCSLIETLPEVQRAPPQAADTPHLRAGGDTATRES